MMRARVLLLVLFVSACSHYTPPVVSPAPPPQSPASDPVRVADGLRVPPPITTVPPPDTLPHPTVEYLIKARAAMLRTATDTVTPTESTGIEFCSLDPKWSALSQEDKWVLYKIDGVQQSWPGFVVPTHDNCFMSPKAFIFPAGVHEVVVALVYPPGYAQTCAAGDPTCVPNGCVVGPECYGADSEVLTVLSQTTPPSGQTGPPPPASKGQVIR